MQLADLPLPTVPKDMKVSDLLPDIVGTPEYQEIVRHLTDYPRRSLTYPQFRALMYVLIRLLRPKSVLEIGTMYAGTAELFSVALMANGSGKVTTIDPFGGTRVPAILDTWSAELRQFVDYRPISSMDLFTDFVGRHIRPDIIFVDGNHQFEYALFDLQSAARSITPDGIVIMDNYDLAGVIGACAAFESANPSWQPVRFSAHPSFGSCEDRMKLDGLYRIYVAPSSIAVGKQQPVEFFSGNLLADGVRGFRLALAEPSPSGRLHYQLYFRIYPWNFHEGVGDIEQFSANGSIMIPDGVTTAHVVLKMPLVTPRPIDTYHRRADIALLFDGDRPLQLVGDPAHELVTAAPSKVA